MNQILRSAELQILVFILTNLANCDEAPKNNKQVPGRRTGNKMVSSKLVKNTP